MSLDMLATRGTLVLYGQSSGPVEPFDPGALSGITGAGRGAGSLTLRWAAASHYLPGQQDRAEAVGTVLDQVRAGRLAPRIAGRFPLADAAQAHARLASRAVAGKILLRAGAKGVGVSGQDGPAEREGDGGANG
jgi:NADPH2:quinone reductase